MSEVELSVLSIWQDEMPTAVGRLLHLLLLLLSLLEKGFNSCVFPVPIVTFEPIAAPSAAVMGQCPGKIPWCSLLFLHLPSRYAEALQILWKCFQCVFHWKKKKKNFIKSALK